MVSRNALPHSTRGFTLVELMVVIAIMAVMASIAAPSINSQLANRRMKAAAFELSSSILQARSLAASYARPVGLMAAYAGGWNVAKSSRDSSIRLPNASDVSSAALINAQLSWYVVAPGGSATVGATMADSTTNNYPIRVSLPDQSVITMGSAPSVLPTVSFGVCFYPAGSVGSTVSSAASCTTPSATTLTRVSFRICDSAVSGEAGYAVVVGPFGTVRTFTGRNPDTADTVGNALCT